MTGITLGAKRKNLKGKLEKPEAISQKNVCSYYIHQEFQIYHLR